MNRLDPKRSFLFSVLLMFMIVSQGCVFLIVGSLGALGGYIVSPDTVEGTTDSDYTTVVETALDIVSIMGRVEEQSEGRIVAVVNSARVTIDVVPFTDDSVKMRIKARKALLPNIATAQDIYIKIMEHLQ